MKLQASLTAVLAAAALGFSGPVAAQPLFPYDAYGGFVLDSDNAGDPGGFPTPILYEDPNTFGSIPDADPLYSSFNWGTGSGQPEQSNLTLNDPDLGLATDDPIDGSNERHVNDTIQVSDFSGSQLGYLTHNNNITSVTFDNGLVDIDYYLDLFAPTDPDKSGEPIAQIGPLPFQLQVWETTNADLATCPDEGEFPTGPGGALQCGDRFRYRLAPGGTFGDSFDETLAMIEFEGTTYRLSSTGFFDEEGVLMGAFWSPEGERNTGLVRVEAHEAPAPGTLGLLGLGLVALAWLGGRRWSSAPA